MSDLEIRAQVREGTGKGSAKKLRRAGLVPAILYAKGYSKPLVFDSKEFFKTTKNTVWSNTIFKLRLEEKNIQSDLNVMIKDHQFDPLLGQLLHADFYEISMDKQVTVKVPIVLKGEARGVESGGVLVHRLSEIEIECLPSAIPHQIEADISALDVGESLHVADLKLSPQIRVLNDLEAPVASVSQPSAIAAPPAEIAEGPEDQPPEE